MELLKSFWKLQIGRVFQEKTQHCFQDFWLSHSFFKFHTALCCPFFSIDHWLATAGHTLNDLRTPRPWNVSLYILNRTLQFDNASWFPVPDCTPKIIRPVSSRTGRRTLDRPSQTLNLVLVILIFFAALLDCFGFWISILLKNHFVTKIALMLVFQKR